MEYAAVIESMQRSGQKSLESDGLKVVQQRPGTWLVQKRLPVSAWARLSGQRGKSQVEMVKQTASGLAVVSCHLYQAGYQLSSCVVAGVIRQLSGTCYFNTAVNQLCLGVLTSQLVLHAIQAQVTAMTDEQKMLFYDIPLDFTACPLKFTWLDTIRLFYALTSQDSPTKLEDVSITPGFNVMAQAIYASGHRNKNNTHEGGDALDALQSLLGKLDITFCVVYEEQGAIRVVKSTATDPQVLITLDFRGQRTLTFNNSQYVLDSGGLAFILGKGGHAVTGVFCDGAPMVVETNSGLVIPVQWVTERSDLLTRDIDRGLKAAMRHAGMVWKGFSCREAYVQQGLYVKPPSV